MLSFGTSVTGVRDYALSIDANSEYLLCWCEEVCQRAQDFLVPAGHLRVSGPFTNQEKRCYRGQTCVLEQIEARLDTASPSNPSFVSSLRSNFRKNFVKSSDSKAGVSMESGDLIRILEACGEGAALYDFPGSGLLATGDACTARQQGFFGQGSKQLTVI